MDRALISRWGCGLAFAALLAAPRCVLSQQGTFSLGFDGPSELSGAPNAEVTAEFDATLTQTDVPPPTNPEDPVHSGFGAQGWSISLTGENLTVTGITTAGSEVPDFFSGGFNKTQVVDPAKNNQGDGAVSAIVLSFTDGNVLPDNRKYVIAKLQVKTTLPEASDTGMLIFKDGFVGAGQPVANVVTVAGATVTPGLNAKTVARTVATPPASCCDDPLNFGFSEALIRNGAPFAGIAGVGDISNPAENCAAATGEIRKEVPAGQTGAATVYANVISRLPVLAEPDPSFPANLGGAQGWSFSIRLDGNAEFGPAPGITTAGTAADTVANGGYWEGGFNKTQVVDPAKNGGQRGAVSAIVLSFTGGNTLPPGGVPPAGATESVLKIDLVANAAQGAEDIVGMLTFQDGLIGAGQPVNNVVTVAGGTVVACNADPAASSRAKVNVVFGPTTVGPVNSFVRGDANNDRKVNIADPIWILNELLRDGPESTCQDAADGNNDGAVDVSDATFLITYLFGTSSGGGRLPGDPPPAPFPACGTDPEGDDDGVTCAATQEQCR